MDWTRHGPAKGWTGRASESLRVGELLRALGLLERRLLAVQVSARTVAAAAAALGCYALVLYARADLVLVQGDAIGHVYVARRTIDSVTPSFAQLGYVWLPLPHLLMLPLVWNDTLWHTGLAGSIVSLAAFALATAYMYRTICALTGSGVAGLVGAALFATNPNLLFMQATPMAEALTLFFIIGATHYMVRWAQDGSHLHLMLSGAFVLAGTLTRYEAWWLVPMGVGVVAIVALRRHGLGREIEGLALTWLVLAAFGVFLWLMYNFVIFGSALHFINSSDVVTAQSFARERAAAGVLTSKGDPLASAALYGWAVIDIAGLPLVLAGVAGFAGLMASRLSIGVKCAVLLPASLFLFEIVSLSGAQSAMLSPHSAIPDFVNTRYGLLLLPALVLTASLLARQLRLVGVALLVAALIPQLMVLPTPGGVAAVRERTLSAAASPGYTERWADENFPILQRDGPVTLIEAIIASRTSENWVDAESAWLRAHAKTGKILISEHFRASALMLNSRLPLSRFIYEGNKPYFPDELGSPGLYTEWIVYQPGYFGDGLRPLVAGGHPPGFALVFEDSHLQIFHREAAVDDAPESVAIPPWAHRVRGEVALGDTATGAELEQIFFALRCRDGIATLVTTRATLYADMPCDRLPDDHALLGLPVRLRLEPAGEATAVFIDTDRSGLLSFTAGRAWLSIAEDVGHPDPRPAGLPPTARALYESLSVGDPEDTSEFGRLLFAIRCQDELVSVVTTKEILYTELGCDSVPDERPFLGKWVRLSARPGFPSTVSIEADGRAPLVFTSGSLWLDSQ